MDADIYAGLTPNDSAAVEAFDRAFAPFDPDPRLLRGVPGKQLTDLMMDFVAAMDSADFQNALRRRGWWSRFSGADLEARLILEVDALERAADMKRLAEAAGAARQAMHLLAADWKKLAETTRGHQQLATRTAAFLQSGADPENSARLQRRLANLETTIVSNRMAGAQIKLAVEHLKSRLEQFTEIAQRLYPVWRQHALALAQGASADGAPDLVQNLQSLRRRLSGSAVPVPDGAAR